MKKKIFKFVSTCIMAGILFSSCSITKRHYTNGYYVDHHSNKQVATKKQEYVAQNKVKPPLCTIQNVIEESNLDSSNKQSPITENDAIKTSNRQVTNNLKNVQKEKHMQFPSTIAFFKKDNRLLNNNKIAAETVGGDVLSLFWIVILILVILWLIALLTGGWGLGGFIYLLLVIALILLILWLLRII